MKIIDAGAAGASDTEPPPARPTGYQGPGEALPEDPSEGADAPRLVHDWSDTHDRERMIAEAAYFRFERRGFELGEEELDWFEAERELTVRMETDRLPEDG